MVFVGHFQYFGTTTLSEGQRVEPRGYYCIKNVQWKVLSYENEITDQIKTQQYRLKSNDLHN